MKSHLISVTYLSMLFQLYDFQDPPTSNKIENEKNCRERNRLITTDKGDLYRVIDATFGQKLILQCHFW